MAVRETMGGLIGQVRGLANLGTADYTVGTVAYWSDAQVQEVLDRHRVDVVDERVEPVRELAAGGSAAYFLYELPMGHFETTDGGTAVFVVRDGTGTLAGTGDFSVDYGAGRVRFADDQMGTVRYVSGRSYDVYRAAGEIWEMKAASVAERFDFSADGASFKVSQLVAQYERMAERMRSRGRVAVGRLVRDDVGPLTR